MSTKVVKQYAFVIAVALQLPKLRGTSVPHFPHGAPAHHPCGAAFAWFHAPDAGTIAAGDPEVYQNFFSWLYLRFAAVNDVSQLPHDRWKDVAIITEPCTFLQRPIEPS